MSDRWMAEFERLLTDYGDSREDRDAYCINKFAQAIKQHLGKRPTNTTPTELQDAYRAGWETAANWMNRDDLIADVGSPAYLKDMADALAPMLACSGWAVTRRSEMSYDLKALRAAADNLTDKAFQVEWTSAAINWGDFCCVSAEHYVTEDGAEGYRVYFEEAAPENVEFCRWVERELAAAGFKDVEAVCEW